MKAEADLLTWNYQPAIETLNHATHIRPGSFPLLIDLATAYFERAEASSSPADYEASLNYLGDAIRLEPANPAALFNRAIVYERLYLYGRAIEDWQQFLKIETDPGWQKEAEQRLQQLRAREHQRGQRQVVERLTLAQFTGNVKAKQAGSIEEYLEAAERQILPKIDAPNARGRREDQNYQAASVLADELQSAHGDRFLKDLLRSAGQAGFLPAVKLLGKSSSANHEGRSDEAYAAAMQASAIFRRSGNVPGDLAAGFEQAYAMQFQSRAASCQRLAGKLVQAASQRSYVALNIQLLLEQAICSNMNRGLGTAKNLTRQALSIAKRHAYQGLYLRGISEMATLESEAGDESSAWSAVQEGLGLCWKFDLPTVRVYSMYALLARMAQHRDHPNVQFAAAFEALQVPNSSLVVEASERLRLSAAALRLGQLQVAESQARQAEQVFASGPQTGPVRWRELEARLWLAEVEALRGADVSQAERTLSSSLPEVEHLSDRYLEFQYYDILSDLKIRSNDVATGERLLRRAIQVAEDGLRSLPTWRERLTWMDQHRRPYAELTELLFRSGDPESALSVWEHFRAAEAAPLAERNLFQDRWVSSPSPAAQTFTAHPSAETRVITYAFQHNGLMIWVRHVHEVHSAYLQVSSRDVQRAAENLIGECSRPDSDLSNLRSDAQYLYKWLIQPVRQWLPASGHMIVEPDGILGVVPLETLMDSDGSYLGARYAITMASSVKANDEPGSPFRLQRSDAALIAAAPGGADGSMKPVPGAIDESLRIAEQFEKPIVLGRGEVQVSRVRRELAKSTVFHFAGHAGLSRSGASMLMADGILGTDQARAFAGRKLSRLKLAVFSACGTAKTSEMSDSDSLVTAFLQAGAQNVVASRWNVDSMATAEFVDLFYRAALSGASVADGIQIAAVTFRKMPQRAHPYYWAAFAAFGRA